MSDIEVRQSSLSASRYDTKVLDRELSLTFLSASKGKMDFTVEHSDSPLGKFNLLSQHSIARIAKALDIPDADKKAFTTEMLQVGAVLRDGKFILAPIPDRIETEKNSYFGLKSSLGVIEADTIEKFLSGKNLFDSGERDSPSITNNTFRW